MKSWVSFQATQVLYHLIYTVTNSKLYQSGASNVIHITKEITLCVEHKGQKFYLMHTKQGKTIRVTQEFFDSHKQYVKKVVIQGAYVYHSYPTKDRGYKPQLLETARRLYDFVKDKILMIQGIRQNFTNPHTYAFIIDFLTIVTDMFTHKVASTWITILCRVYSLILRFSEFKQQGYYLPQSNFIDLAALVTAIGLPSQMVEKLRIFQSLATSKITCSTMLIRVFRSFMDCVYDFLDWADTKVKTDSISTIRQFLKTQLSFITHLEYHERISNLYSSYIKNPQEMHNLQFREKVLEMEEVFSDMSFIEFLNECRSAKEIAMAFKMNILKYAKTYTVSSRTEPVCVVFEGPAGCLKSTVMNALSQLCKRDNRSVYSHIIPSNESGKDFYDDYENQDVFVIDDIGQQGLSQWRTIINFVSPVKMPLDCANAEKKNTKFFNSNLILGTTNLLTNIQAFTAKDCITSKEALFRRIHVFKFEGERGVHNISYFKYDHENIGTWRNAFLSNMEGCQEPVQKRARWNNRDEFHELLRWMYSIIKYAEHKNAAYAGMSVIPDSDLDSILTQVDNSHFYDAQSFEYLCDIFTLYSAPVQDLWNFALKQIVDKCTKLTSLVIDSVSMQQFALAAGGLLGLFICVRFLSCREQTETSFAEELYEVQSTLGVELPNERLENASKHVFMAHITSTFGNDEITQVGHCFATGRFLITNNHLVGSNPLFDVFVNASACVSKHYLLNNCPAKVVKRFVCDDLVCVQLDRLVCPAFKKFKYLRALPFSRNSVNYLLNRDVCVTLINRANAHVNNHIVKYVHKDTTYLMSPNTTVTHPVSLAGMCGSVLVDVNGDPLGHHICGREGEGVVKIWSEECYSFIRDLQTPDIPYEMSSSVKENFSGIHYLQDDLKNAAGCSASTICQSDMYDLLKMPDVASAVSQLVSDGVINPVQNKAPANLNVFGTRTIPILAEKSYKPIPRIPSAELDFVRECLGTILPSSFEPVTLEEAVFGNERLPPLNKKASSGYGYSNEKSDYIDFESRFIQPKFKAILDDFTSKILSDTLQPSDIIAREAIKDELRVEEKVNKPRTFRVMQLHHIVLTKKLLANLFLFLKENMWENGICVGMNPYLDFDKLYSLLRTKEVFFDGDFGSYDGSAPSQLQDLIVDEVLSRFAGSDEDRAVLRVLLYSMVRTYVLTREKLLLTTHSMPSGCWVTALFNSLLNRCLTALCIRRFHPKYSVSVFLNVFDFVLGDDKIVGVMESDARFVNALSMRNVAESLGMTYTDAFKGEILEMGKPLDKCQFLKRTFAFHPQMLRMCGVLDMSTILQSLRYFDSAKDYSVVMGGKLIAFQYEIFLYGPSALKLKHAVLSNARRLEIAFREFSDAHILQTMVTGEAYPFVCELLCKYVCNGQ